MAGKLIVLGSLNVDLTTHVQRHPAPGETVSGADLARWAGGKGANQAAAAARTAPPGVSVAMVGAVGDDEAGAAYRQRLTRLGVDVSAVEVVAGIGTGHALITVDAAGENSIVVIPGANGRVTDTGTALSGLGPGDVLLAVLEVPLPTIATAAREAHAAGARVVLNLAPYADLPADVIALADPVIVNEHEARQLADSGLVATSLVTTLGGEGVRWDDTHIDAEPVPAAGVLDTTGAGDAFCGALAAALAAGADRATALQAGIRAGAATVRHHGAQPDPQL